MAVAGGEGCERTYRHGIIDLRVASWSWEAATRTPRALRPSPQPRPPSLSSRRPRLVSPLNHTQVQPQLPFTDITFKWKTEGKSLAPTTTVIDQRCSLQLHVQINHPRKLSISHIRTKQYTSLNLENVRGFLL